MTLVLNKLGLGTAQFGMDYGATNRYGVPSPAEVKAILQTAHDAGVRLLDTAPAYGGSETVLGESWPRNHAFQIVAKTPLFNTPRITSDDARRLTDTFLGSLERLKQSAVYGLLAHHADDLLAADGQRLLEAMESLKHRRLVQKIGVSVYSQDQIDRLLDRFSIDLIQLPLSVLDQRLVESGCLSKLAERGVEIHVRSAFLQGILVADPAALDDYFRPVRGAIEGFQGYCGRRGLSPIAGALAFCAAHAEVAKIVVGVCNMKELGELLAAAGTPLPADLDFAPFACSDERIVNPALWTLPARSEKR